MKLFTQGRKNNKLNLSMNYYKTTFIIGPGQSAPVVTLTNHLFINDYPHITTLKWNHIDSVLLSK